MRRFWHRLAGLGRHKHLEQEMEREMASHLALLEEEFLRRGCSPEEARLRARREYGGLDQSRELHREARTFAWVEQLLRDARYGARSLARTPLFTSLAVLTLALGLGANTALFSVVNAVLLRPLDYRDSNRLVTLQHHESAPVGPANFLDWRAQCSSFSGMEAAEYWTPNLAGESGAEQVFALRLTPGMFPLLGVEPLLGHFFTAGQLREVVLSYPLWQRRFHADPHVVGRTLTLNGDLYTVAGVMPAGFRFAPFWATKSELWAPLDLAPRAGSRGGNSLRLFARLRPGVSLEAARAEVAGVTARLDKLYPATNRNVRVTPLKERVVGKISTTLLLMLGACGLVLIMACANVAHMLLARTADRQREIAVRAALGAGRRRLLGQFLTEHLLLAALGAAAGLALAWLGVKALVALSPTSLPRLDRVSIDATVLLVLLALTLLTALLFGLAPMLRYASGNLSETLKEGGRSGSLRRHGWREFLLVSEFALAFVLLVGAGLLWRSFSRLLAIPAGFEPDHLLTLTVSVAGTAEESGARRPAFYRDLVQRLATLPGVRTASGTNHLPLAGDLWGWNFEIQGRPKPRPGEEPGAVYRIAMPGYFETMGIRILRGRGILPSDTLSSDGVAVINQRAAQEFWPGQNPLGQRITFERRGQPVWLTIVGVTADTRQYQWASRPEPEVYLAALQNREFLGLAESRSSYLTLVLRTAADPAALAASVRQTIWQIDRGLSVSAVQTMDEVVSTAQAQARFELLLFSLFAAVALALAAAGIHGVMSHSVERRTREIGIRMSLGATAPTVVWMVAARSLRQAGLGAVLGLAGALALGKLLAGLLYEIQPGDPGTLAAVAAVLLATAVAASLQPARRATRIEATIALRTE